MLAEGVSPLRGMNIRIGETYSVILMSILQNALHADRFEENDIVVTSVTHITIMHGFILE